MTFRNGGKPTENDRLTLLDEPLEVVSQFTYLGITAMTLFRTVITPIATYGINIIWNKLTNIDLALLETVKSRYMKRVLGIGKTTPSRITYLSSLKTSGNSYSCRTHIRDNTTRTTGEEKQHLK